MQLFGSGPILREALRAQELLAEKFGVSADVWSATSYKLLRGEALHTSRWNMLHPAEPRRRSYLESVLADVEGPFVAASDYLRMVPDQIAPWVPGIYITLGTDGFGHSDTRPALRRFFEVDAECIALGALYGLAREGRLSMDYVNGAITELGIDPDKTFPFWV